MLVLPSWEIQLGLPPGELAHCPEEFSQRPAVDPPRITLPARNPRVTPPRNPQALLQKQRQLSAGHQILVRTVAMDIL